MEKNHHLEDLQYLRETVQESGKKLRAYRRIHLIWGIIILTACLISQYLVWNKVERIIPFIWIPGVAAGILISILAARKIRKEQGMNPLISRHLKTVWFGGCAVILSFFGFALITKIGIFPYLPALSFSVIGLCTLITGSLFRSKAAMFLSTLYFLAMIPAAFFPQYGLLLEGALIGGGAIFWGLLKNDKS